MNWEVLISIVARYGLPLAEKLWRLAAGGAAPTEADWAELHALSVKTATSQLTDALVRAGIDPASPEAKALLALTATVRTP